MMAKLQGKKTYIVCFATIAWSLIGGLAGWIEWNMVGQMVSTALMGAGLRNGIK